MAEIPPPPLSPRRVELILPWETILKVLLAALLTFVLLRVYPLLILLLLAMLVAIAFSGLLERLLAWGWPRWLGVTVCAAVLFAVVGGLIGLLVPAVTKQGSGLLQKLPELKKEMLAHLPETAGVRASAEQLLGADAFTDPAALVGGFLSWSKAALHFLSEFLVMLVISLYFLAEGEQAYRWLLALFPERHRQKFEEARPEFVSLVRHYVVGQAITSAAFGLYVFGLLTLFHIPSAIFLAVVSAVLDVLPLIGIVISTGLAMAVALTVSPAVTLWVGLLFFAYHMFETYVLVPKVYGHHLQLSPLVVLLSCLGAVLVGGLVGAIVVLPLVASYPMIERLWLKRHLPVDTVPKHEALTEAEEK